MCVSKVGDIQSVIVVRGGIEFNSTERSKSFVFVFWDACRRDDKLT